MSGETVFPAYEASFQGEGETSQASVLSLPHLTPAGGQEPLPWLDTEAKHVWNHLFSALLFQSIFPLCPHSSQEYVHYCPLPQTKLSINLELSSCAL